MAFQQLALPPPAPTITECLLIPQSFQLPVQTHFPRWFKLVHQTQRQGGCNAVQAHRLLASSATETAAISREDSSYCLKMSSQNSCPAELSKQCKAMTSVFDSKQKAFSFPLPKRANSELQHAKFYSIVTANV